MTFDTNTNTHLFTPDLSQRNYSVDNIPVLVNHLSVELDNIKKLSLEMMISVKNIVSDSQSFEFCNRFNHIKAKIGKIVMFLGAVISRKATVDLINRYHINHDTASLIGQFRDRCQDVVNKVIIHEPKNYCLHHIGKSAPSCDKTMQDLIYMYENNKEYWTNLCVYHSHLECEGFFHVCDLLHLYLQSPQVIYYLVNNNNSCNVSSSLYT